jgi:PEGA domain
MRAAHMLGSTLCAALLAGCGAWQPEVPAGFADMPLFPGLRVSKSLAGVVDLASDPSGAQVTTSLGAGCQTPCSLEVSTDGPFTVTFTHEGYTPTTVPVKIQRGQAGVSDPKFAPNPVLAQLSPAAKPTPPQTAPRKPVAAAQPAARPAPAQVAWPEPVAGFIVKRSATAPADAPRPSDNLVARRWLESFDKPASDQDPDKKKQ